MPEQDRSDPALACRAQAAALPLSGLLLLCRIAPKAHKDVDVLFYGCLNPRRNKVLRDIHERGHRVKILNGVYGRERDEWIARSKLVLNHHFYETQIFEIVRTFYLLTNAIPVAAEVNPTTQIDDCYRDGLLGLPYDELAGGITEILQDDAALAELGARGKATIEQRPQTELMKALIPPIPRAA